MLAVTPTILRASLVNLQLVFALLGVGLVVGTIVAVLQVYGGRAISRIAYVYEWIFRSIPALVLIFLFYYGPAKFGWFISAFQAAVLALGLRSSAYQSQIFRGAIEAIPAGQMLAARSMGMGRFRAVVSIILPQAFRLSIAGWTNEFSSVIKDTTLVYAAGYTEILRTARAIYDTRIYLTMPTLILVAIVFLVFTYGGNRALGLLERKISTPGLQMPGRAGRTERI